MAEVRDDGVRYDSWTAAFLAAEGCQVPIDGTVLSQGPRLALDFLKIRKMSNLGALTWAVPYQNYCCRESMNNLAGFRD